MCRQTQVPHISSQRLKQRIEVHILYADDIVIFANDSSELQSSLDVLLEYCQRWKLKVKLEKTNIMVFRKGGRLSQNLRLKV